MAGICILIAVCTITPTVIMTVQSRKWMTKQTAGEGAYVVYFSPLYKGIGMAGIAFGLLMTLLTVLFIDANLAALIFFLAFTLLGLLTTFVFLFWVIVVYEDRGTLVYYHPPFRPMRIRISEITKVQFLESQLRSMEQYRIRIYQEAKMVLEIDDRMIGFYRVLEYLKALKEKEALSIDGYNYPVYTEYTIEQGYLRQGGIETAEFKDGFSVTETTSKKVIYGVFLLFLLILDILVACDWREWTRDLMYFCYFIVFLTATALYFKYFVRIMLYKVSVRDHRIYVRDGIGRVSSYVVQEIMAIEKKDCIVLYTKERRTTKIFKDYVNFASFEEWLYRELVNGNRE